MKQEPWRTFPDLKTGADLIPGAFLRSVTFVLFEALIYPPLLNPVIPLIIDCYGFSICAYANFIFSTPLYLPNTSGSTLN